MKRLFIYTHKKFPNTYFHYYVEEKIDSINKKPFLDDYAILKDSENNTIDTLVGTRYLPSGKHAGNCKNNMGTTVKIWSNIKIYVLSEQEMNEKIKYLT